MADQTGSKLFISLTDFQKKKGPRFFIIIIYILNGFHQTKQNADFQTQISGFFLSLGLLFALMSVEKIPVFPWLPNL
jgi:uncharacterized membrane protein SirB2